jgi:hypothetical protein
MRVVNVIEQRPTRIFPFWFLSWKEFVSQISMLIIISNNGSSVSKSSRQLSAQATLQISGLVSIILG